MCVGVESKLWKQPVSKTVEAIVENTSPHVKYSLKYSDDDTLKWAGVDRNRVERDFAKENYIHRRERFFSARGEM